MSIRFKVLGAIALSFLLLFVGLYLGARSIILNSFETLEQDTTRSNLERILAVIDDNFEAMTASARDYAWWDDTYNFVQGNFPEYADSNVSASTLANLNLNLMLFANAEGAVVLAKYLDLTTGEYTIAPNGLASYLTPSSPLFQHADSNSAIAGFIRIPEHLVMLASVPIMQNDGLGEVGGALVFARYFDAPQVAELASSLDFDLQILDYASSDLSIKSAFSPERPILSQALDENTIAGYGLLYDINNQAIAIIQANMPRDIYQRGLETLNVLGLVLLGSGAIMTIVSALALEGVVTRRITKLSSEVDRIQETGIQQNKRVGVSSNDEVSKLSKNINTMLDRIETSRKQLSEQNTALKVAYQQAEEATRLKSEFLSTMSHELRTPLNAIVGYAGIMLEGIGGEIDGEARTMIENISESSEHLLKLINDILDISKIEAGRLEIVAENFAIRPLVTTVSNNLRVLAEQKHLAFAVDVDENVPMLLVGDKERLSQILINLLSNAFKFTDKGAVGLYMVWQEEKLVLRVRDTGIGIPPHALQYIFDEFRQVDGTYSRNYQGTGLGLAIVKKLVEAMGGAVTVESRVGEGSIFTVTLPLKSALQTTTN